MRHDSIRIADSVGMGLRPAKFDEKLVGTVTGK
jgi:hypothetical protein